MTQKNPLEFRSVLSEELSQRMKRNPLYSMRSFARDLNLSPPRLSNVLKGRYSFSPAAAREIATRLKLSPQAQNDFLRSVMSEKIKKKLQKMRADSSPHYEHLSSDIFLLISQWHHFAILELPYLKAFEATPQWIAKKLGIEISQTVSAIERLKKLNLLQILRSGKFRPSNEWTMSPSEIPSDAIKSFHTSILSRAIQCIYTQDVEERHYTTTLLAISKEDLPEAKREIDRFRDRFVAKYGKGKGKDSVYAFSSQFFDLGNRP